MQPISNGLQYYLQLTPWFPKCIMQQSLVTAGRRVHRLDSLTAQSVLTILVGRKSLLPLQPRQRTWCQSIRFRKQSYFSVLAGPERTHKYFCPRVLVFAQSTRSYGLFDH